MNRDEFKELLEQNNAVLFGQLTKYVDSRLGDLRIEMNQRFDQVSTTLDGIAKRLENDDLERAAIDHQLNRHEGWIGQLAERTGTKLIPER